jgi:hypothetical protein
MATDELRNEENENEVEMSEAEAVQSVASTVRRMEDSSRDPNKPRLIIHKIVLENFKSYAGVKEIGPFHSVIRLTTFFSCSHQF